MNGHEKIKNQSRKWLSDSLLELMQKRNYGDITIGQIAEHAGLSRRTFYRSFKSKEEVMDYITASISLQYEEHLFSNNFECFEFRKIAHVFFSFFEEHYALLKLLQKNGLEYQILKLFNYYLPIICEHLLDSDLAIKSGITPNEAIYVKYFTRFNCGGFFNLLLLCLENDEHLNAAEMEASITTAYELFWHMENVQ